MRETPVSDLNLRRAWCTVVNFCVALLLYYQETEIILPNDITK